VKRHIPSLALPIASFAGFEPREAVCDVERLVSTVFSELSALVIVGVTGEGGVVWETTMTPISHQRVRTKKLRVVFRQIRRS
jgi:hypothetical protein